MNSHSHAQCFTKNDIDSEPLIISLTIFETNKYPVHNGRGGSMISGKGVHMYKSVGVCFAYINFFFFVKYPMKMK